ncbi:MAG: hypothetical protein ACKVH2_05130 [Flavobacteriales bacterium]|jgi:hypothetical protein|tara:strand:+ start:410 stop:622 length:213 start_codon:yes stop_codon:yes gene_type:complete
MFYILKIKGTKMIPDFIQIRDEKMTLRAYFRVSQKEIGFKKNNLDEYSTEMIKIIKTLPFGKIHKFIPKA